MLILCKKKLVGSMKISKNATPFLLLFIFHFCLFLFTFKRKSHRNTVILLLSNIGFAFIFEYLTLNLFHGYRYKPDIFKKRFFDNILGAILSQAIYVPITATFLTVTKKNWKWKICASFIYYCIEKLFIFLKIYKVYWWKPVFTLVLLNGYFYISDGFYRALSSQRRWALAIGHYFSILVIWIMYMYASALRRKVRFGLGHFHSWTEHFKSIPLYSLLLSLIAFATSRKHKFVYRLLLPTIHIILDKFLKKIGVLKINFRYSIGALPWYAFMVYVSRFLYKIIYRKQDA